MVSAQINNLQRFLDSVTPIVPSRTISQSHTLDINPLWQPAGKEMIEYFTLNDLWQSYEEWSAYGAETQVLLHDGTTVKQYYVPYLSALQIFTDKSIASNRSRRESNVVVEFESDSWSDDSGSDKLSRSLSNNSSKTWDSISEDSSLDQAVSWPVKEKFGHMYFEYFETCPPNQRLPLAMKIDELAKDHAALKTLKSVDVSPASWMAVAWYPIYHIPSSTEKDLSACFLTYHTLSSSFLDGGDQFYDNTAEKDHCCNEVADQCCQCSNVSADHKLNMNGRDRDKDKDKEQDRISLAPFGITTYKMQGVLWVNPETWEYLNYIHLQDAAHSWVKQLGVYHHDLNFFTCYSNSII